MEDIDARSECVKKCLVAVDEGKPIRAFGIWVNRREKKSIEHKLLLCEVQS